ncbi:MAG: hypothetical protein RLN81_15620 [Balneolaceae bacterium]
MLIGGDFNKKGKKLLQKLLELSEGETEAQISVEALNEAFKHERKEIRNLLEYLESTGCVKINTIGGPFLYGHISITEKGIYKASKK